jgi:F-type H+-transporting ATPase subunit delta
MSAFNIASRYAKAFYEYAESNKLLDKIYLDMALLENSFAGSKELRVFLSSPVIKPEKKLIAVEVIFREKISDETWKFLVFILDKGRENFIFEIARRFNQIKNEKLGIVEAVVQTNYSFDESDLQNFKSKLESLTKKKVLLKHCTNEKMTGGFLARIGDTVIDGTIESQLQKLKKKLVENINS